ncbi:hypothetical protein ACEWET_14480 [Paraliobacillus sp. JSM ZJ581]
MEYLFASVTSFDMYKTTKSLQVIKNTEYGMYGLVSANGFSEYLTGKDILGNALTTSQRQASLSLGLAGILPTAIELTPALKGVTKDITKKAHERVVRNTQSARAFVDHWFNGLVSQTDVAMAGGPRLPINAMRDTHVQQEIHTSFAKVTKGIDNTVNDYIDDIIVNGNVDVTKMNKLKNAVQNNTFSVEELSELRKQMSELGISKEYDEALIKMDFGKYLRGLIGDPPTAMIDPHAHHILFKKGLGEAQQKLVLEGQEILRKHGVNPLIGKENLVWAQNRVAGQHSITALENVVNQLKVVDAAGADLDDIIEILEDLGK